MHFEESRTVLTGLTDKMKSHKDKKSLEIYHDHGIIKDFHREARHYHKVQGDRLAIRSVEIQNSHHVGPKKALR